MFTGETSASSVPIAMSSRRSEPGCTQRRGPAVRNVAGRSAISSVASESALLEGAGVEGLGRHLLFGGRLPAGQQLLSVACVGMVIPEHGDVVREQVGEHIGRLKPRPTSGSRAR